MEILIIQQIGFGKPKVMHGFNNLENASGFLKELKNYHEGKGDVVEFNGNTLLTVTDTYNVRINYYLNW